jgi:serine/threonine-protein kinase
MFERRYDEALQTCRELAEFDPSFHRTYTSMGRIYALQGRYPEALEMLEKGRGLAGNMPSILAAMAQVHALAGERERAAHLRLELSELAKTRYVPLASFAIVHLGLGEHEKALEYLEAACEQRDLRANVLKAHPLYDPLRAYPRFQAILHRLKFPL